MHEVLINLCCCRRRNRASVDILSSMVAHQMVSNDGMAKKATEPNMKRNFYCKIGYRGHYLVYPAGCAPSA